MPVYCKSLHHKRRQNSQSDLNLEITFFSSVRYIAALVFAIIDTEMVSISSHFQGI